jgi:hypothetical protein
MQKYILEFVSVLVRGCVGEFKKTDQQGSGPTDQLCSSFCFLNFNI